MARTASATRVARHCRSPMSYRGERSVPSNHFRHVSEKRAGRRQAATGPWLNRFSSGGRTRTDDPQSSLPKTRRAGASCSGPSGGTVESAPQQPVTCLQLTAGSAGPSRRRRQQPCRRRDSNPHGLSPGNVTGCCVYQFHHAGTRRRQHWLEPAPATWVARHCRWDGSMPVRAARNPFLAALNHKNAKEPERPSSGSLASSGGRTRADDPRIMISKSPVARATWY